jgi:prepilin-type N-terminal cleavage/methylation domain-containing protein
MNGHPHSPARAFTLIELVVAIVIMAVMVGLIVPRLLSTTERRTRAEVESVADVVTVAARRASLSTQRVSLAYDSGVGLRVMIQRAKDLASFQPGNLQWVYDPLAPSPSLEGVTVTGASLDGKALTGSSWLVDFFPASRQPDLSIGLEDSSGRPWTVVLTGDSVQARAYQGTAAQVGVRTTAIDLDNGGKGDQPW